MNSTNIMPANEDQYVDHFANVYEALPKGKAFRLTYDPVTRQLKVIAKSYSILEELRNAFSADNPTEFIAKQYGYNAEKKVYQINKFGYFAPGLVFEVMKWIQIHYGDLSFLAISQKCKNYIIDNLMPLKKLLNGKVISVDDLENVSDATGRNENAKLNGKDAYVIRDYQAKSIVSLIQQGFGRGMIEIPTSGGKSFIIANFIWNVNKFIDPKMKVLIFVPNTQLVEQFYKDLIDYGYLRSQLARFTGSLKAKEKKQQDLQNAKIIIANRQYLYKNWQDLPVTDILVCDECLRKNTLISTISGKIPIENITTDDFVLSFNEKSKCWEYKQVEAIHTNLCTSNSYNYFLKITLEDGKFIEVTPNHKIFTSNRGYIRADQLNFDDDLVINL